MTKLLKGVLGLGLLLTGVYAVHEVRADSLVTDLVQRFLIPTGAEGTGPDIDAKWSKPFVSNAQFSTTAVNPFDGTALIRTVCATTTATAGGYVVLYDADNIGSVNVGASTQTLLGVVTAKIVASTLDTSKQSCESFPRGQPTSLGLVHINSDASIRTVVTYDKIRR